MESMPFVMAGTMTLGFGVVIAIVPSVTAVFYSVIAWANLLTWCYLAGPAATVSVRRDVLEIRNPIMAYTIPREQVLSVESVDTVGVRVRMPGDRLVWVSALSPGRYRFQNPSPRELLRRAEHLGDALFATPATAGAHRESQTRYRLANLLVVGIGAIGIGVALYLSHRTK